MQGEEVDQILLGPGGVAGDRAYGFVDVDTGRLASAKQPKRFGALLDCHARFLTAPTEDSMPPIEVTFPDGTVVRTDGDDVAELVRRTAELLGASSPPHRTASGWWTWRPCTCWPRAHCGDWLTSTPTGAGTRGECGPTF
ncbi:MAG TPA: hypothetical protein VF328_12840 [Mycobacterium sp.]